jgi:hypothetical protein
MSTLLSFDLYQRPSVGINQNIIIEIKHSAASSGVLTALLNLLVLNQLSPQGAGN